jgi:hypothetical protein
MPLLQAARDAGQDERVMTVLHAGGGGSVDLSDLGLKRTFTLSRAAFAGGSYNDCVIEVRIRHALPRNALTLRAVLCRASS